MRLYDGSAEYIRADELGQGDTVRCPDHEWREILDTKREGAMIVIVCSDGFGWESPEASRWLRKIDV